MVNQEKVLRAKFYLAPKETTLDQLNEMDQEFTAYPGLTMEQAIEAGEKWRSFESGVWINGKKQ
jgi:hypothetical protein